MKESQINWKKGDLIRLGQAVAQFNRKKRELENEKNKNFLPEDFDFSELKSRITTRKELERRINSLKRFSEKNAKLTTTDGGIKVTKWELQELNKSYKRAEKMIENRIAEIENQNENNKMVLLGNSEYRNLKTRLSNLQSYNFTKDFDKFKRNKKATEFQGRTDYEMRKAIVYRQNFLYEIKNLSNNNSDFLAIYRYFKKIKNPIEFFKETQKSESLKDFFQWYQNPENYGEFTSTFELAKNIENDVGEVNFQNIYEEIYDEEFKKKHKVNKRKYYYLIDTDGKQILKSSRKSDLENYKKYSEDEKIRNGRIV